MLDALQIYFLKQQKMKKTKTTFEGTVELVFLAFTNVSGLYTVMMIFSHQEAGDNLKKCFF